jgi:hypothetical protein
MLRLTAVAYWLVLITWFAAIVAAAVTAIAAFGTLSKIVPDLGIMVPQFASTDPSGPDAGRFVAGFVAQQVFDLIEVLQWFLVPAILLILLVQWASRWPEKGALNTLRVVLLLMACGATVYFLWFLAPRMSTALNDYRGAIRGGDMAAAVAPKEAFDRDHQVSDPLLRTTGFLLLGVMILSAATLTPRTVRER